MSKTTKYFDALKMNLLTSINTAMPCKILSYDEATCTAKIQPLFKVKEVGQPEKALKPIENVPALKQKYRVNDGSVQEYVPVYEAGNVVLVVFAQRAIDDALQGKMTYPGTRMFSLTDAVIVGVW